MADNTQPNTPHPRALRSLSRTRARRALRSAVFLILPFAIVYLGFLIYPMIRVIILSFTNSDMAGVGHFIGGKNYSRLVADAAFWQSLLHTIYFILLTVIPNTFLGLLFAVMITRLRRSRGFVMSLLFLPYVLPVSVATNIFLWVLDSNFGIINEIFHSQTEWFQDPNLAMPAVAFVTIWWTVGFNILLFISGLQNIPDEYYEAAALDGAGRGFKTFRFITWPLIWPVTSLVLVLQLIAQWQIFNQVYLLTGGGPYNHTRVTLLYMYQVGFQNHHGGYAATIAVVLFFVILVTSLVQLRFLRFGGN